MLCSHFLTLFKAISPIKSQTGFLLSNKENFGLKLIRLKTESTTLVTGPGPDLLSTFSLLGDRANILFGGISFDLLICWLNWGKKSHTSLARTSLCSRVLNSFRRCSLVFLRLIAETGGFYLLVQFAYQSLPTDKFSVWAIGWC